ncbi:MAG: methylmalonyl Co-A mutase-associated GTPase MeaB [Terriglobia bacterium]
MTESQQEWAEKIAAGDRRAIARAISAVENGEGAGIELLKILFPKSGEAYIIGVTGSPGAGKSTLVEKLAGQYRAKGLRVGIVAVDPTSPFSGGAILGDRIRMQSLATDDGVYIRSMATRGHLGGLAPTAHDVVSIMASAGCQVVLIETVGVGQDEVEVARYADAVALLLVPGMGDDVQTFKAGVMEIADLYVINKADRPGAERVEQEVTAMLAMSPRRDGWAPPIIRTVATTGDGVAPTCEALEQFREFGKKQSLQESRRRERWRARLLELLRQRLFQEAIAQVSSETLDAELEEVLSRRRDPHSVVEDLMGAYRRALPGESHRRRIHHVGIAVESLAAARPVFEKLLGKSPDAEEFVQDQKVRVAVFNLGASRIELLEATSPDSPIARSIAKRGQGIHHLTLAVPDLEAALTELERAGIRLVDRRPRVGAGNERIAFLHPSSTSGVLIELVEGK